MNRSLLGCLVCGLLLAVGGCQEEAVRPVTVMVASTDLPVGTKIAKGDVIPTPMTVEQIREKGWPTDYTMLRLNDVVGRVVKEKIVSGDAFLTDRLYPVHDPEVRVVSLLVPKPNVNINDLRAHLARLAIMSRNTDQGCLRYEIKEVPPPPNGGRSRMYLIDQQWHREDDFNAHKSGRNYQEIFLGDVQPLVTGFEQRVELIEAG